MIVPLTAEDVVMLYEARIPLESTAAKLAAVRASEDHVREMGEVIEAIKGEVSRGDLDPVTLANLNGEVS